MNAEFWLGVVAGVGGLMAVCGLLLGLLYWLTDVPTEDDEHEARYL